MKKILITIITFFLLYTIHPEIFRFKYIPGTKYKIEASIKGKQYINDQFANEYSQEYKTVRTIKEEKDNVGTIEDVNYNYNIHKNVYNQILELVNESVNIYLRDMHGRMSIGACSGRGPARIDGWTYREVTNTLIPIGKGNKS